MVPEAVSVPGNAPTKFVLHSYDQFQQVKKMMPELVSGLQYGVGPRDLGKRKEGWNDGEVGWLNMVDSLAMFHHVSHF